MTHDWGSGSGDATTRRRAGARGASELVAVVLLFGLVMTSALLVLLVGSTAIDSVREESEVTTAKLTMQEVDQRLSTLAYGNGDTTRFDIGSADAEQVDVGNNGTVRITVNDHPACTTRLEMGQISYRTDDGRTVAYQAGGVWERTPDGSSMLTPPTLEYRNRTVENRTVRTIRFPVVSVDGNVTDTEVVARTDGDRSRAAQQSMNEALCLAGTNRSHLSQDGTLQVRNVTIEIADSPYYEAWGRYLRDEFGAEYVTVSHGNETVVADGVPLGQAAPEDEFEPSFGAILSPGTPGHEFVLKNKALVDSYDSSVGPYSATASDEGLIRASGPVTMQGQATVEGDLDTGKKIKMAGQTDVTGHVGYGTSQQITGGATVGSVAGDANVPDLEPIDGRVTDGIDAIRADNDNGYTPLIDGDDESTLNGSARGTLDSGRYYFDSLTVDESEQLTFDTSDGDVLVAVDDSLTVAGEGTIEVVGDGQVVFYVRNGLTVKEQGTVTVPGDRANGLWTYCTRNCDVKFTSSNPTTKRSTFVGVLYAPTEAGDGSLVVGQGAQVYGALVGGKATVRNHAEVHFDTAIPKVNPPERGAMDVDTSTDAGPGFGGSGASGSSSSAANGTVTTTGTNSTTVVDFDARISLMGATISGSSTYNGYDLKFTSPITSELKFQTPNGTETYTPWHDGDPNDAVAVGDDEDNVDWPRNPNTATYSVDDLPAGTSFTATATSYGCDDRTYTGTQDTVGGTTYYEYGCSDWGSERISINSLADADDENVKVLRDGDEVPGVDAAGPEQRSLKDMLGPKLNATGHLDLDPGEFVFLFELTDDDATWSEATSRTSGDPDYNDMVLVYEITDVTTETTTTTSNSSSSGAGATTEATTTQIPDDEGGNGFVIKISNSQVVVESDDE